MRHFSVSWLLAVAAALSPSLILAADDTVHRSSWTQWRGPHRDGSASLPDGLRAASKFEPVWRATFGPSYSGPLVVDDRVFTTETRDQEAEVVSALDRNSGELVWQTSWPGALKVPFFASRNGDWIRATPAYDNGRLYVAGMRDVLVCLDATDGTMLWRIDFPSQFGTPPPAFGNVCSPLVFEDHVYVQAGAAFVKLHKDTGDIVWRTLRDEGGMDGSAFSSPVVSTLQGKQQLVAQTRSHLCGVDIDTGAMLWSVEIPSFRGMNILTPTVVGDAVFTSSYGGRSMLFDIARKGEAWDVKRRWLSRAEAYMSSPVVIDGYLYMHLRNQRFCCIEIATGMETWRSEPFGRYASLIADENQILALEESGELHLIDANPNVFNLLWSKKISDQETWAHLAVSGNQIFVRELEALSVFQWRPAPGPPGFISNPRDTR